MVKIKNLIMNQVLEPMKTDVGEFMNLLFLPPGSRDILGNTSFFLKKKMWTSVWSF